MSVEHVKPENNNFHSLIVLQNDIRLKFQRHPYSELDRSFYENESQNVSCYFQCITFPLSEEFETMKILQVIASFHTSCHAPP